LKQKDGTVDIMIIIIWKLLQLYKVLQVIEKRFFIIQSRYFDEVQLEFIFSPLLFGTYWNSCGYFFSKTTTIL